MKRSAPSLKSRPPAKKPRTAQKPYCDVPPKRNERGNVVWPAPDDEIAEAQRIIRECAAVNATTVICPDKDADGLTSGVILWRTLVHLGLDERKLKCHLLPKGETVHTDGQRAAIAALLSEGPSSSEETEPDGGPEKRYLFVLDHGTAASPPLAPPASTTTLIIDHHFSSATTFPESSTHVNASHCPPVATTALLTYELCKPLYPALEEPPLAWLCAVGTHGDLGTSLAWTHPFPDMGATFAAHSKKSVNDAVSLLNAPRRTAAYDVRSAWDALLPAPSPSALIKSPEADPLRDARAEVNAEVSRWQGAPPKFSLDGEMAVVRIQSAAQVHPVIATRWAGTLSSRKLRIVMCANSGYLPDKVNFSCRIARCAVARAAEERRLAKEDNEEGALEGEEDAGVDIIAELKSWAARHPSGDLLERMGSEFARGHVQASGGIVGTKEFEDLMSVLRVGEKPPKTAPNGSSPSKTSPSKGKIIDSGQTKKLTDFFGKKA